MDGVAVPVEGWRDPEFRTLVQHAWLALRRLDSMMGPPPPEARLWRMSREPWETLARHMVGEELHDREGNRTLWGIRIEIVPDWPPGKMQLAIEVLGGPTW